MSIVSRQRTATVKVGVLTLVSLALLVMIRVIFMYVCFGPVFYWFISSRFKKRGFMTVLTFAKPDNQGELVT